MWMVRLKRDCSSVGCKRAKPETYKTSDLVKSEGSIFILVVRSGVTTMMNKCLVLWLPHQRPYLLLIFD